MAGVGFCVVLCTGITVPRRNSLMLFQGCFLLLFGRIADLYGRKKVFLIGTAITGICSLVSGFLNSGIALDVLRALTGIGPAATLPAAASLTC